MHQRIDNALRALRQDLPSHLDESTIHAACRMVGHTWRECLLTPVAIIHWFITQVLHGNTALNHISLFADRQFTDSAYCQAAFGVTAFGVTAFGVTAFGVRSFNH
jgi:hypothetical protein